MAAIAYHVVDRFLLRLPASSGSFVSNGDNLYSYGLRLAHWEENEIVIDFEGRAPSVTTARHMRALAARHVSTIRTKLTTSDHVDQWLKEEAARR